MTAPITIKRMYHLECKSNKSLNVPTLKDTIPRIYALGQKYTLKISPLVEIEVDFSNGQTSGQKIRDALKRLQDN